MEKLSGREIRDRWIRFFESKGHRYIPGVSLIPQGDKSLLWVNAGVTGLKKYFDGTEVPPCRRIVNVQKSIRTNDIDNVGHTARHHTFFEMLGNFSIGDYFRKEVIAWAYEILTDEEKGFGMDPRRLYCTYNPADKEAFELWKAQGIEESHLIPLEGNFWQIGEGPCGPNTEVFYDRGEAYDPEGKGVEMLQNEEENDRYIEIWGIVFSQYNAVNGVPRSEYKELPSKNIDTGAGLERIACILQGAETNFETDLFLPIIHEVERISGKKYEERTHLPFRVIADHARCLAFALSDGASFSNEGRGYVLRRLIRRAMRHGRKLGLERPFVHLLMDVVAREYGDFYPNLRTELPKVRESVRKEEERFLRTLLAGEEMLSAILDKGEPLDGETVFRLYDTYGFPASLTKEIAEEKGISVDMEGFERLMERQKELARSSRGEIESFHSQSADLLAFSAPSEFSYEELSLSSEITGIFKDGKRVSSLSEGEEGEIAFLRTPFYVEKGGQVSDTGWIEGKGVRLEVGGMRSAPRGQSLHHVLVKEGEAKEGDTLLLHVDESRRKAIERHHSATHLLHAALSEVLGEHVEQKGSFVGPDYLRFDFTHGSRLSEEEIRALESKVASMIERALPEKTEVMSLEEARGSGAEMEFEGKYGDTVRVVSFSEESKELCGGTHVRNASELMPFLIVSEEAIGSGLRRITAKAGVPAYEELSASRRIVQGISRELGVKEGELPMALRQMEEGLREAKKRARSLEEELQKGEALRQASKLERVGGVDVLLLFQEGASREELLSLGDHLKANRPDHLFVLVGGKEGSKPVVILAGGKALQKVEAGSLMKDLAQTLGGKGGGRKESAAGAILSVEGFPEWCHSLKERLL